MKDQVAVAKQEPKQKQKLVQKLIQKLIPELVLDKAVAFAKGPISPSMVSGFCTLQHNKI